MKKDTLIICSSLPQLVSAIEIVPLSSKCKILYRGSIEIDSKQLREFLGQRDVSILNCSRLPMYLAHLSASIFKSYERVVIGDQRSLLNGLGLLVRSQYRTAVSDGMGDLVVDDKNYERHGFLIRSIKSTLRAVLRIPNPETVQSQVNRSNSVLVNKTAIVGQCLSERCSISIDAELNALSVIIDEIDGPAIYFAHPEDSADKLYALASKFPDLDVQRTLTIELHTSSSPEVADRYVGFYSTALSSVKNILPDAKVFYDDRILGDLSSEKILEVKKIFQFFQKSGIEKWCVNIEN